MRSSKVMHAGTGTRKSALVKLLLAKVLCSRVCLSFQSVEIRICILITSLSWGSIVVAFPNFRPLFLPFSFFREFFALRNHINYSVF